MKTIGIIGGGAAGMMAAVKIAENLNAGGEQLPAQILLFEKNAYLGAKVLISGGGRCNVTTGITDVRELLKNYPRGAKFLMSAMYHFPPTEVMAWFSSHGAPLKTEEDMRVFPVSDNGKYVVGALENQLKKSGVKILCGTQVYKIEKKSEQEGGEFTIFTKKKNGQSVTEEKIDVDFLVLTTGGNAYRQTGSTGDGYDFAKTLGHTITPLGPSLNALTTDDLWIKNISGVSFERVALRLTDSKNTYERTGAFVFTHHGVSGPAIFALSSFAAYEDISKSHSWTLYINFFPTENVESMRQKIDDLIAKNPKKKIVNLIDAMLPKSLAEVFVQILKTSDEMTASHLNREQRDTICNLLTNFPLHIVGRSAGEEFVSAGGVSLGEVNTNTMESKLTPHLFFAGELLDIDGFTGGFNLQASWATGALAGEEIAKKIQSERV